MESFTRVFGRAGSTLPSLNHLASSIRKFQEEFSNIFENYVSTT
jgi:hypothetical protein